MNGHIIGNDFKRLAEPEILDALLDDTQDNGFDTTFIYPYPHPEQLRTVQRFWKGRFALDFERANDLTDGYALKTPDMERLIFYKEETNADEADLSDVPGPAHAVAVDTRKTTVLNPPFTIAWVEPERIHQRSRQSVHLYSTITRPFVTWKPDRSTLPSVPSLGAKE